MSIQQELKRKLQTLIYPSGTKHLDEKNSIYLGTTRLRDVPGQVDEFFRLWFIRFNNLTKWFFFLRDFIESWWRNHRFISFLEYQDVYKDKMVKDGTEIQKRYPVYKMLGIASESHRQRFVNSYPNRLDGYFHLMKTKNADLWNIFNSRHTVRLPFGESEKHTYVLGGTGSGKSELLKHLILQDIGKGEKCVIVIEPNGDLSEQIVRQQGIPQERLIYIDCSLPPRTPSLNPFELVDSLHGLELEKQSQIIRVALQQIFQGDGQPLTLQMQSILEPCLEIVAQQKGTLKDLQRFMLAGVNEDLLEAGKASPKHGDFFQRKFNDANINPSRQGIYQKLMNLLNMTTFTDFFCGKTTIDLEKAVAEKKIIIFNLSKGKLGDLASSYIGRMLTAIIQNIIFQRANIREENRTPVSLYIDEFQDFINESAEQMFVQGRKYKVSLTVASQVIGQKMTTEMTRIVLGNTNVKFVGMNGYETLRVMSKETYTEIEELKTLSVGEFFCRIGNGEGFILKVPEKHLKWKTCISEMDWEIHLNNQVQKYYKVRPEHKSSIPATPTLPHPKDHERKEKRQDNNRNKGNKQAPKEQNTIPPKPKQVEQAREPQEPPKEVVQTREPQEPLKDVVQTLKQVEHKPIEPQPQQPNREPEPQRPSKKKFTPKYK